MSPNNEILFNDVLIPKLLNNLFPCCSLIHLDFLLPHIIDFDDNIGLTIFNSFASICSVSFLHFK